MCLQQQRKKHIWRFGNVENRNSTLLYRYNELPKQAKHETTKNSRDDNIVSYHGR